MSSLIFRPWIPPSLLICSYHILAAFTTSNPYAIPFPDKGEKSPMVILSSVTPGSACAKTGPVAAATNNAARSEEHTSELQSLMRISYAVFCLKKKNKKNNIQHVTLPLLQRTSNI